jgi:hypothetical protein
MHESNHSSRRADNETWEQVNVTITAMSSVSRLVWTRLALQHLFLRCPVDPSSLWMTMKLEAESSPVFHGALVRPQARDTSP